MTAKRFKNPRAEHGFQGRSCSILSVGSYVPEKVLTNADLEKLVETTDDWITSRTGIKERRIAAELADVAMHFHQDVLNDFLGVLLVAHVTEGELIDLAAVSVDDVDERLLVATLKPFE